MTGGGEEEERRGEQGEEEGNGNVIKSINKLFKIRSDNKKSRLAFSLLPERMNTVMKGYCSDVIM